MLLNELKKIEARKKERERKTQDLQKLISQADQQGEIQTNTPNSRKQDKKLNRKKLQNQTRPSKVDSVVNVSIKLYFFVYIKHKFYNIIVYLLGNRKCWN